MTYIVGTIEWEQRTTQTINCTDQSAAFTGRNFFYLFIDGFILANDISHAAHENVDECKFGLKKEREMNKNAEHNGSCSCGFVRYSINEDPLFT